jgi:hypothetical protein
MLRFAVPALCPVLFMHHSGARYNRDGWLLRVLKCSLQAGYSGVLLNGCLQYRVAESMARALHGGKRVMQRGRLLPGCAPVCGCGHPQHHIVEGVHIAIDGQRCGDRCRFSVPSRSREMDDMFALVSSRTAPGTFHLSSRIAESPTPNWPRAGRRMLDAVGSEAAGGGVDADDSCAACPKVNGAAAARESTRIKEKGCMRIALL